MIDLHAPLLFGDDRPICSAYRISKRRVAECIWQEWHLDEPMMSYAVKGRIDWAAVLVYGGIGAYVGLVAWCIVKAVTR